MLPFKIKLTTFIHQTYLDIISPNLYILYFKSFCWYFVVEKPNSRYCFACNQEEKNITLPKNNNQRALYENEKLFGGATALPSRGASEWWMIQNQKHVGLDQLYLQNPFDLNTQNSTFNMQISKTRSSPHSSLYQTKRHTHMISHYHYHGKDAISNCLFL